MNSRDDAPADRLRLVKVIFFICGMGMLLPWNFFMTASSYFTNRLNTSELRNGTEGKEFYFNSWMNLLSHLPLFIFTLLNSLLYQRVSEKVRIAGSLMFILFFFILTAVLVKVPMEQDTFFSVTMATIWFINMFGAVCQGGLFGLVGLLPQRYSTVFMSGQGIAGTFAAVVMLIDIASNTDSETAALFYFIVPCVVTLITLLGYMLLPKLEFAQFYLYSFSRLLSTDAVEGSRQLIGHSNGRVADKNASEFEGETQPLITAHQPPDASLQKGSVWKVFKKIWVMAFCVTFVFTVTLSVFPVVTVDVKTVYGESWERYFIPVCCFLNFNVMDFIGRAITYRLQWPSKESRWFPVLVVLRVIFLPLLMLCNVQERHYLPVLFPNDWSFSVIMVFFSISNGYFATLSMSYAPQLVDPADGETAGALMMFFLALGLCLGAAFSFPLRYLV